MTATSNPAERAATPTPLRATVEEHRQADWVELEIWRGDTCVLSAEIDDELLFAERLEIAQQIAGLINASAEGRQP